MATESAIDHPLHAGEHPERHEHSDLSITGLVWVFIIGALVVGGVLVLCYYLFWFFQSTRTRYDLPMTSLVHEHMQTPEPRIQGVPGFHTNLDWQDLAEMKQQVNLWLTTYGPTQDKGYVHIPINHAMALALKDGTYKVRPQSSADQGGTHEMR